MRQKQLLNIAQMWHKRSDEENFFINQQQLMDNIVPWQDIKFDGPMWVFSHIPKTAGTSLEGYLLQAFSLKEVLHINAPDLNQWPQCVYMKNKYPTLITGHHPMHGMLYQLLTNNSPMVHISMMREPITRIISYYNYLASRNYHALHHQVKKLSFDQFINQQDMVELRNGQAKRLTGLLHDSQRITDNELYNRAKHVIDNCFSLVGVTEKFNEFHQLIGRLCGVRFHHLPPINRSKVKVRLTDLNDQQLSIIEQRNRVDIQLYEYAKSLFNERHLSTMNK